jgi:hypothetical protein
VTAIHLPKVKKFKLLLFCGTRPLAGSRSFARQLSRATEPRGGGARITINHPQVWRPQLFSPQ